MNGKHIMALVIGSLASGCSFPHAIPTDSLQNRLNDLAREKPTPPQDIRLAMCYQISEPKDVEAATFLCPDCGRKTRHPGERAPGDRATQAERDRFRYQSHIPYLIELWEDTRKPIADLAPDAARYGLKVSVDSTDLCAHCRHTDPRQNRYLYLVIEQADGKIVRTPLSCHNISLLKRFMQSKDWSADRDSENSTLRDYLGKIETILGIKAAP